MHNKGKNSSHNVKIKGGNYYEENSIMGGSNISSFHQKYKTIM